MNRKLAAMAFCFALLATAMACFSVLAARAADTGAEVLAFEKEMEAAVVRGDVTFLDKICDSDFSFTHGDG